jgi:hypothetical protein
MPNHFSYHEYRIVMGDTVHNYGQSYPGSKWAQTAEAAQERGYMARLERRFVADISYRDDWYPDGLPDGWMIVGGAVAGPWEIRAEIGIERRCVIVG